jgi:ubiquinone/menaquinone biosynthesis C-methylase UbiE
MHKYLILALSLCAPLHCMEQQIIKREPREWDAQAYDKGNQLQADAFLYFLNTNNINIENKTILDVGCGTGKITAQLAEKATHIHGFDASKNMITFAQDNHGHINNVSFEHCFAEDFTSPEHYQLALASFCVHWFEDRKQAFQRINDSLEIDGEFFGPIRTTDNPEPLHFSIFMEMMPSIKKICSLFVDTKHSNLAGSTCPSHQELTIMLCETGFEIIKSEEQSFHYTMSHDELIKNHWPIFLSRPIIKSVPEELIPPLFEDFMNRYVARLQKTDDGKFMSKIITTIVHARKVKK